MNRTEDGIRVLLLADSHLGFDLPLRPRLARRRRGFDFQANHDRALEGAVEGGVDLVVHGGDVFHRPRVPPSLCLQAFRGLLRVAEAGVPVFVVPGNHERSRIPHAHLASHPLLHIFHEPRTVALRIRNRRVALTGFPYHRGGVREAFPRLLEEAGWGQSRGEVRLLAMHHCVEGARVGPRDHVFRNAPDVVRASDLPGDCAAVMSGHIHRHQVLRNDLNGRPLPRPVLYPGSVERTAFAEVGEPKGFVLADFSGGRDGGHLLRHEFVELPSRPMILRDLHPPGGTGCAWTRARLLADLTDAVSAGPLDAVLRVRIHGVVSAEARQVLSAAGLRRLSPPSMNLEVVVEGDRWRPEGAVLGRIHRKRRRGGEPSPDRKLQTELALNLGQG